MQNRQANLPSKANNDTAERIANTFARKKLKAVKKVETFFTAKN